MSNKDCIRGQGKIYKVADDEVPHSIFSHDLESLRGNSAPKMGFLNGS